MKGYDEGSLNVVTILHTDRPSPLILFTIGTLVINIIYFVLLDRLMMAAVQRRTGPYNVGYFGLLQPMDDGLKLVKNEVIIPKKSSCILFLVVPNLFFYCSLIL